MGRHACVELSDERYEKARAKWRVNDAIRHGKLAKGAVCEQGDGSCKGRLEGHHDDYRKPLEVRWLCASHHKRFHRDYSATVTLPQVPK